MIEPLFARIDSKREELVSFTQELVSIPTINPPGEDYLKCAELLGNRLAKTATCTTSNGKLQRGKTRK